MEDTHVAHSPRKRVKLEHHPLQLENTKMSSTLESGSHQEDEIYHDPPEYVVSQEKVIEQPNANETRLAKEEECGILEFVKPSPTHPGFSGIMKKRYELLNGFLGILLNSKGILISSSTKSLHRARSFI